MEDDPAGAVELEATQELTWFRRDGVCMSLRLVGTGLEYYSVDPYLGFQHMCGFQTFGEFLDRGGRFDLPEALEEVLLDEVEDLADPDDRVGTALEPVRAPSGVSWTRDLDRVRVQLHGSWLTRPRNLLAGSLAVVLLYALVAWVADPFAALFAVIIAMGLVAWLDWGRRPRLELDGRQLTVTRGRLRRVHQRVALENVAQVGVEAGVLVIRTEGGQRVECGHGEGLPVLSWLADGIESAARARRRAVDGVAPDHAPQALRDLVDR